ncbi:AAA domain-containing protein [Suillus subaureus]|uniref:AAA domain-containing protein n=2 Tax=Suillus subaureus TaxID=48587 RepID=A0A9P7JGP1_9AGAM|nr:AAA domain-containing protein [Suillus subaureus]KAG1821663.1 AAA domain-containing protein [Suillus subaureus]
MINTGPMERTIWLVAHSNVAVKNIAEKLDKVGFREFKLLVSKDFHYDWHKHLYERLEHCFIRSDMFGGRAVTASQHLLDKHTNKPTRVVLCTLSMLSNPRIDDFTRQVPVHTVIFDEASQIEVGEYLPLLQRFQHSLKKMVFIGDDKQLAPFGQDDIGQLRSIFEFPHLREQAHFLDTQYRMPLVIGSFISRHVYDQKLMTVHDITNKAACRFLDVKKGKEEKSGKSWANQQETSMVIHLARIYHKQGKQFRIITPYDGQRSVIEKQLQSAKLPWEDKCFNVDSFQGNEEDHIIVSLVRTQGVGFLTNMRRMNVMLTRCKMSMIICTNRDFVTKGKAADTLVGQLALTVDPDAWLDSHDIVNGILR